MTKILKRAAEAIQEGRFAEILPLLESASKAADPDPEVLVYLGIVYVQLEEPAKAVEVLQKVQEQVEDYCVVSLFLGRALHGLGRFDEAAFELKKALSMDPSPFEGWTDLGDLLITMKEFGEAAQTLEMALKHFPDEPALRSLYATTLHKLGDYRGAAKEWGIVSQLTPDSVMALSNHAYLLLLQRKVSEAEPIISRAEKIDPKDCRLKILHAEILIQRGEYKEAETFLMDAVESDDCYPPALARLAVTSFKQGNDALFSRYLQKTKEALVEDPDKWWALYYIYRLIGWTERMTDVLIDGTKEDRGSAAPWVTIACHYESMGMLEDAEQAWQVSFRIRRYVKLYCKHCGEDSRIPYDDAHGFDIHVPLTCEKCESDIAMPQGLASI
ncbi:MAG: tetratricopeptide repeat protein [Candidatus Thorarchaeota archaeon]|nr:MAG: tetratricopeptide repeat protein [Candidatus Thorarchaeota archaeon]